MLPTETDVDFLPVTVFGTMVDVPAKLGAFEATATLTKAGDYSLQVLLNGLKVPTYIDKVNVPHAILTNQLQSNFTGIEEFYLTGETITLTIFARDVFENFRPLSTSDTFQIRLTGQSTSTVYGPFIAKNTGPGIYAVSFKFTIVEAYTVDVLFAGGHIKGSPVPNIEVFQSLV